MTEHVYNWGHLHLVEVVTLRNYDHVTDRIMMGVVVRMLDSEGVVMMLVMILLAWGVLSEFQWEC